MAKNSHQHKRTNSRTEESPKATKSASHPTSNSNESDNNDPSLTKGESSTTTTTSTDPSTKEASWFHNLAGPTCIHLQHEWYLWCCVICLTMAGQQSLFHYSTSDPFNGNSGDYVYFGLTILWMSRYGWLRWVLCHDQSTSRSPSWVGVLAHWWSSYIVAGQYMDRPSPSSSSSWSLLLTGSTASSGGNNNTSSGSSSDDSYGGRTGTSTSGGGSTIVVVRRQRRFAALTSLWSPSVLVTWRWLQSCVGVQWPDSWYYYNMSRSRNQRESGSGSNHNSSGLSGGSSGSHGLFGVNWPSMEQITTQWSSLWSSYGPSLHAIIPISALCVYGWFLYSEESQYGSSSSDGTSSDATDVLMMFPDQDEMDDDNVNDGSMMSHDDANDHYYGSYKKRIQPSWIMVLLTMSTVGTCLSMAFYGRVILPLCDLVAGTNVLKAVRSESKGGSGSGGGGGGYHHHQGSGGGKSSKAKTQRDAMDQPWPERYFASIVTENRGLLILRVLMIRLIENLFVCYILPRTKYVCRFTGHCAEGSSIAELSRVLFQVGIYSGRRKDLDNAARWLVTPVDWTASILALVSVLLITTTLLLTQAAISNRSYLGIMGYIAGEWTLVDSDDPVLAGASPSPWDPRRRYRKGDLIAHSYPGFGVQYVYMATSNSPEGRPFDLALRATHDLFRDEVGHPATSNIIGLCSTIQLGMVIVSLSLVMIHIVSDMAYVSLLWSLAANLLATYAMLSINQPNYFDCEQLAKEINA